MKNKGEKMELRATLDAELAKRFQVVKEHNLLLHDHSVLALLISREFNRIERSKLHRVFLPKEIYETAEKLANSMNLTLYEYIDSVTAKMIEDAQKGVKNGAAKRN